MRDEYASLYGQRTEERLNTGPLPVSIARAKHREWSSEIEARIANIRSARKGEGRTLTPKASTSAGRRVVSLVHCADGDRIIGRRTYGGTIKPMCAPSFTDQRWPVACSRAIPSSFGSVIASCASACGRIIADEAKSNQFLAAKRLVLDAASRDMFLDHVTRDFFAALALLARRARGDHGPDKWVEQFPRYEATADPSLTPWTLFERWIAKAKPASSTVDRWRGVFLRLQSDFPNASAAALLPEQMQVWANRLIDSDRTAGTVANIWVARGSDRVCMGHR